MCGHVSLLCLCLLFVSSSVQGGQENLPSTWTRIVRQDAQARLDEGKEGADKTFRMFAEQLSSCNARTQVLQTKLDEGDKTLRTNAENLTTSNSRTLVLQALLEERKEASEETRRGFNEQLANFNSRLDEAQQKLITTSLNHQKIIETLRAENLRIKQQLEDTTINFEKKVEKLEEQLAVTTGYLKNKTLQLNHFQLKNSQCNLELITLKKQLEDTTSDFGKKIERLEEQLAATKDLTDMVPLGGSKYYFSNGMKKSWHDAKIFCENLGLHFVSIESSEENQLILDHKEELGMGDTWVGGTDKAVEGTWRWIGTGQTLTYINWRSDQPDGGREEDCMEIRSDGKWHDYICSIEEPFICEM